MLLSLLRILFHWNSIVLTSLVCAALFFYLRRKNLETIHSFKVFVPLNPSIITFRKMLLEDDVFLFLCVKFWHRSRCTVDFKMRFCIGEKQLQMSHFFIDFYSVSKIKSMLLNNVPAEVKFKHGRVYLDRKLLKAASWNTMEMSYVTDLGTNFFDQVSDEVFVVNGWRQCMSWFLPVFEHTPANLVMSLNLKSDVHSDALFIAPVLERSHETELYINYEQKRMGYTDFYLLMSATTFDFVKHTFLPVRWVEIELQTSKHVIDEGYSTKDIIRLITGIVLEAENLLTRGKQWTDAGENAEPLQTLQVWIVSQMDPVSNFYSKDAIVVTTPKSGSRAEFRLTLAQLLLCSYAKNFFCTLIKPKIYSFENESKNPFADTVEAIDLHMEFASQFISASPVCIEARIVSAFMVSGGLFRESSSPPNLAFGSFSNNFQVFEYVNYIADKRFRQRLQWLISTNNLQEKYLTYTICLSGDRAGIRTVDETAKELHSCHDCLYQSAKSSEQAFLTGFEFFLFSNIKFSSGREFVCLLHFFSTRMGFKLELIELYLRVIKSNSKWMEKPKYNQATINSLVYYFDRFRKWRIYPVVIKMLRERITQPKNVFCSKSFADEFWRIAGVQLRVKFTKQMKHYLKTSVSFQKYFHLKHKLI